MTRCVSRAVESAEFTFGEGRVWGRGGRGAEQIIILGAQTFFYVNINIGINAFTTPLNKKEGGRSPH